MATGRSVLVTAGGRTDLEAPAPPSWWGGRRQHGGPWETLDLLAYGTPAPLGLDPTRADRRFTCDVGRRPGFLDGKPGSWWSINGHLFPEEPMFVVREGDVVVMTVQNHSDAVHPMHLHGHQAFVVAFVADNPE